MRHRLYLAAAVMLVASTILLGLSIPSRAAPATLYAGAFLSSQHQSGPQSFSGNDVVVTNRSYVGVTKTGTALVVHDAHNVTLTGLDFDGNCGDIFLIHVTGVIRIEGIRARNTGGPSTTCPIGSGHKNVIQFNDAWQGALGGVNHCGGCPTENYALIRSIKVLGGQTEDIISVYKSGGIDAQHPLVIGDPHLESPLPPDPNAWASNSGTCVNLGDAGGHDVILQNGTALNCGQVGLQINKCTRCTIRNMVVYGAQRSGSNVGISRYGSCSTPCSGNKIVNNRVFWRNASGSMNNAYGTSNSDTTWTGNVLGDTTINPANLHVVL